MDSEMSPLSLPYGGAEILALRRNGKRPADMVLVSLIGPLLELNPIVIAKPECAYDWRFLARLYVTVVCTTQTEKLSGTVKAIEAVNPDSLSVWFCDQQDGVNVFIDGWKPRSKDGRRMGLIQRIRYAGLGSVIPAYDCLQQIEVQAKRRAVENAGHLDRALVDFAQEGFRRIFNTYKRAA